jgi:hypothetical protein
MTFHNCNILTYSIIISFAYVSLTYVYGNSGILRSLGLACWSIAPQCTIFLIFLNMKNSRFGGKLPTQVGEMKRLVILPTLCRCIYCLINKSFSQIGNYMVSVLKNKNNKDVKGMKVITKTDQRLSHPNFTIIIIEPNISNQYVENLLTDSIVVE